MQLVVCILTAWIAVIAFGMIPKRLSEMDMVILFFVDSIFAISVFTTFELNLHWITVNGQVDRVFGILVSHIIQIPLVMLIVSNVMLYSAMKRWWIIAGVWALLVTGQLLMKWIGVIEFTRWNVLYGALEFAAFVGFSILSTWFVRWISRRGGQQRDRLRQPV